MEVRTKFLILSDTHAMDFGIPNVPVDVAIHCGDLTEESKLEEFRKSIDQLERIQASLKLVIAGNHDFTLDTPTFRKKADHAFASFSIDPELMKKEYGEPGEARQVFSASDDIVFLDEGIHHFNLSNGAKLTVYASPYTHSVEADWGFQFRLGEDHDYTIGKEVDVVITHGPPKGIGYLDRTVSRQRAGCDHLFSAIAKARPRLHCFGHVHEGWGAMLVAWKGEEASASPRQFSEIDNGASTLIERLATFKPGDGDTPQRALEKEKRYQRLVKEGFRGTSHCSDDEHPLTPGRHTLFVNAAIESLEEEEAQLPWIVEIELPRSTTPNELTSA